MSVFTVTARRHTSDVPVPLSMTGIGVRVRRALAFAGMLSLLLGETIGILQVNPQLLWPWIPASYANPRAVALAGMALIGLACGIIVGLILRGTSYLLRLSVTLFIVVVGLITTELAQGLLLALPLSRAFTRLSDTWELQLLGIGALGAVVGALAGFRRRIPFGGAAAPAPQATSSRRPARRTSRPRQRASRAVAAVATGGAVSTRRRVAVAPRSAGRQRASWKLWGRRRSVHLGKRVSEVCPYCLEEVKPHDRRGRVVCDICGTPHHGDCWAITGKCEVPHLQT